MKTDLLELLNGKTLKSQIYRTISANKFGNISHLLKNNLKKQVKYTDYKTQGTEANVQTNNNKLKTTTSAKKLSQSVDDSSIDKSKSNRSVQKKCLHRFQRSQKRLKAVSQTSIIRNKEYLLTNSQKVSKERKNPVVKGKRGNLLGQINSNIKRSSGHKGLSNNSKTKTFSKVHLESILEKSSSEEKMLITPENKNSVKNLFGSEKTKKKEKKEIFPLQVKKKIQKSFNSPQKFIVLLKNDYLSVSFRVLKKKLIQIQIFVPKSIYELRVNLIKGNVECQKIQQHYSRLTPNTLFTLFSSVRQVDIFDIFNFPQIHLQLEVNQSNTSEYFVLLPYTWLHSIEEIEQSINKKSRIKTKLCLEKLPINPKKLKILSKIFHKWIKKGNKQESQFQTSFKYKQNQFQIKLKEQGETFSLQLQGKGEQKLTNMINFFSKLII